MSGKTLYFEGAGWSDTEISRNTIGNQRICTAFRLDDGRPIFLEIAAYDAGRKGTHDYRGCVTYCFYITDEPGNEDCNLHRVPLEEAEIAYTRDAILLLVNGFGASFNAIEVVPDLGGYRVFSEERATMGTKDYYYGDDFQFDPELTARRQAIYDRLYELSVLNGQEYPHFSLWVDNEDAQVLHELRHFSGYNRHWIMRLDHGNTLDEWLATSTKTTLGRYGC